MSCKVIVTRHLCSHSGAHRGFSCSTLHQEQHFLLEFPLPGLEQ